MKLCNKIIQILDRGLTVLLTLCFLPVLLYGIYVLWDSGQISRQADASVYETYRPSPKQKQLSFSELQKKNPEVFSWLTVADTHIDYPLVQADNNSKYVNTDIMGEFSLSGSIFLDCRNKKDFSDLNNILYGHHMAENAMFGELENFSDPSYFNAHPEGELYIKDTWYKVEFFAFLHADAYDTVLYDPTLQSPSDTSSYLDYIKKNALCFRELPFNEEEHFLTLSTCTSSSTNGRHLLIGRITEDIAAKKGVPKHETE